jgi:hypothetical protein
VLPRGVAVRIKDVARFFLKYEFGNGKVESL